jgi:serine/threonine-protein kinase RsbW
MQDPHVFPDRSLPVLDAAGAASASPVVLVIPADRYYAALIRAVVSHLGARTGFTVTEITDLRLAVDEACALLLPSSSQAGELCCRFVQDETCLRMRISAPDTGQAAPDTAGFGWRVLAALVTDLGWSQEAGRVHIDILKRPLERDMF